MGKLIFPGLLVLLLVVGMDTSPTPAAAPPQRALKLDEILREWAKANDSVRSMRYRFEKIDLNRSFGTRTVHKGEVQLLAPDLLRVDLETPKGRSSILYTKDEIHIFDTEQKAESIRPKPADRSFLGKERPERKPTSFSPFVSRMIHLAVYQEGLQHWDYWLFAGLPAQDLARRFDVQLAKVDAWYIYLDIYMPYRASSDTKRMRVVLSKDRFSVRQIWYKVSCENEVTIDFQKCDTSAKISSESIRESLPQNWKRVRPIEEYETLRNK